MYCFGGGEGEKGHDYAFILTYYPNGNENASRCS